MFKNGEYLTIIRRRRSDYRWRRSRGEYSPIIIEPEANNCFSINTQVIISKKRKKNFNAKSSSLTMENDYWRPFCPLRWLSADNPR